MKPGTDQFPEGKKYWSESARPEHAHISRWNDEVNREKGTRDTATWAVKDLTDIQGEIESRYPEKKSGAHAGDFEVSGDALARLKAGNPAKTTWDEKRN